MLKVVWSTHLPGYALFLITASGLSSHWTPFLFSWDNGCLFSMCMWVTLESCVLGVHTFRVPVTGGGEVSYINVWLLVKPEEPVSRIGALGAMSVSEGKALGEISSQKDQGNCQRDQRTWESNWRPGCLCVHMHEATGVQGIVGQWLHNTGLRTVTGGINGVHMCVRGLSTSSWSGEPALGACRSWCQIMEWRIKGSYSIQVNVNLSLTNACESVSNSSFFVSFLISFSLFSTFL